MNRAGDWLSPSACGIRGGRDRDTDRRSRASDDCRCLWQRAAVEARSAAARRRRDRCTRWANLGRRRGASAEQRLEACWQCRAGPVGSRAAQARGVHDRSRVAAPVGVAVLLRALSPASVGSRCRTVRVSGGAPTRARGDLVRAPDAANLLRRRPGREPALRPELDRTRAPGHSRRRLHHPRDSCASDSKHVLITRGVYAEHCGASGQTA